MKKITSLLLALVMALALAVPAFAVGEEIQPAAGSKGTQDVTANYTKPEDREGETVYYFTVKWDQNEEKNLAYVGEDITYTWNGASMQYVPAATDPNKAIGWQGSNGYKVTIRNQSNALVHASTTATTNFGLTATPSGATSKDLNPATTTADGQNITYKDTSLKGEATTFGVTYTYADTNTETKATAPTGVAPGANTVTVGTITVKVTK